MLVPCGTHRAWITDQMEWPQTEKAVCSHKNAGSIGVLKIYGLASTQRLESLPKEGNERPDGMHATFLNSKEDTECLQVQDGEMTP